jgi:hypothetical protein
MTDAYGVMAYRIGGHTYPRTTRANCPVCVSDYRAEVEQKIASGQHYASIAGDLPEDAGLAAKHLSSHFRNNHMPMRQAAVRRIIEERQAELGKAIEDGVDQIADHVALARVVVQRSFQAIADGTLEPTVSDGIAAAKLLQATGVDDEQTDKAAYVEAFIIYMETASKFMGQDEFAAFAMSLSANPVLKALVNRHQQSTVDVE